MFFEIHKRLEFSVSREYSSVLSGIDEDRAACNATYILKVVQRPATEKHPKHLV